MFDCLQKKSVESCVRIGGCCEGERSVSEEERLEIDGAQIRFSWTQAVRLASSLQISGERYACVDASLFFKHILSNLRYIVATYICFSEGALRFYPIQCR